MSYTVLARKWRPQTFDEIVYQGHVSNTLKNAIKNDQVAHAYLFAGPRGIGKTTTARILAKAMNCEEGPTPTPCNKCNSCKEITESRSSDVYEIDGASNRGIDEIRDLREKIQYAPQNRFKIFIIDEVHMLTNQAFNALLKTLEEPPEYVIFIFATTEPQKVIPTILSRCQRFDFKLIPTKYIKERLLKIAEDEEAISLSEEGALMLAQRAKGALRDALSMLDQLCAYSREKVIDPQLISKVLGILPFESFKELAKKILSGDTEGALGQLGEIIKSGVSETQILEGMVNNFHNTLLLKLGVSEEDITEVRRKGYQKLSQFASKEKVLRIVKTLTELERKLKYSSNKKYLLEQATIQLSLMESTTDLKTLLSNIKSGKNKTSETSYQASSSSNPQLADSSASSQTSFDTESSNSEKDEKWEEIVKRVEREKGTSSGVALKEAEPKHEDNQLILKFKQGHEFQKEHLESKGIFNLLKRLVKEKYGKHTQLDFFLEKTESGSKKSTKNKKSLPDDVKEIFKEFNAKRWRKNG